MNTFRGPDVESERARVDKLRAPAPKEANMWNRETAPLDQKPRPVQMPTPTAASSSVPLSEERRVVAWVGKSVLFRGDLIGLEDMVIDGRVEGTIELREHTLTIGPDAHIRADIIAKVVSVLGTVVGTVVAAEAVHIGETGSVEGDITSRRLAMAEGAVVRGRVDTGRSAVGELKEQQSQTRENVA
jgi:cytoskeletal protein CcmA (bactofilin family)